MSAREKIGFGDSRELRLESAPLVKTNALWSQDPRGGKLLVLSEVPLGKNVDARRREISLSTVLAQSRLRAMRTLLRQHAIKVDN